MYTGAALELRVILNLCAPTDALAAQAAAPSADGRLAPRAINRILEQIGRWHDAEIVDPERQITPDKCQLDL
jgi:hypothetical protein